MVILLASTKNNGFEAKILREIHERIIKGFMDVIIMTELRNGALSGYDVISFINAKFNVLMSSGTVYSLLYSLERDGLVDGIWKERKRIYKLTGKGEETITTILSAQEKIKMYLSSILKPTQLT